MFAWLIVIAGVGFVLFQIFLSSGGRTKFKSDLPKTETSKKKKKVVILVCSSILSVLSLALLVLALISFL